MSDKEKMFSQSNAVSDALQSIAVSAALEKNAILGSASEWLIRTAVNDSGTTDVNERWRQRAFWEAELIRDVFQHAHQTSDAYLWWWWLRLKIFRLLVWRVAIFLAAMALTFSPLLAIWAADGRYSNNGLVWLGILGVTGAIIWGIGALAPTRWPYACRKHPPLDALTWKELVGILRIEVDPRKPKYIRILEKSVQDQRYIEGWYAPLSRRNRDAIVRLIPYTGKRRPRWEAWSDREYEPPSKSTLRVAYFAAGLAVPTAIVLVAL